MKQAKNKEQANKITYQGYSWGLKVSIIEEVENGQISINQASKKYDIGRSTIQKWMNKFGNLDKKLREMGGRSPKQEIEELKKKLARMEIERNILESAIEIVESLKRQGYQIISLEITATSNPIHNFKFLNTLESYFAPVLIFETQSTTFPKGIPLPKSRTETLLFLTVTSMVLPFPITYSSIELSNTSFRSI